MSNHSGDGPAPTFGERLRAERELIGWTPGRLATRCGFDHAFISRLEAGLRNPSRETVAVMAAELDLDRFDTARLYRAAGYWPPSVVGAYFIAEEEMGHRGYARAINTDWIGMCAREDRSLVEDEQAAHNAD